MYKQWWGTRFSVADCWYKGSSYTCPFCFLACVVGILCTTFFLLAPLILPFHIDSHSNANGCHVCPRNEFVVSLFLSASSILFLSFGSKFLSWAIFPNLIKTNLSKSNKHIQTTKRALIMLLTS